MTYRQSTERYGTVTDRDFWSYFPGLPRRAVIEALRIIEDNEGETSMSHIRDLADREARDDAHEEHEHHVNLMGHCYLCRLEAGVQTDRLTYE